MGADKFRLEDQPKTHTIVGKRHY